jgi:acyl carrier protein
MDSASSLDQFLISAIASTCSFERSQITLETSLSDLLMDSLSIASVLSQVEARHGLEMSEHDVLAFFQAETVRDVVTLVRKAKDRLPP